MKNNAKANNGAARNKAATVAKVAANPANVKRLLGIWHSLDKGTNQAWATIVAMYGTAPASQIAADRKGLMAKAKAERGAKVNIGSLSVYLTHATKLREAGHPLPPSHGAAQQMYKALPKAKRGTKDKVNKATEGADKATKATSALPGLSQGAAAILAPLLPRIASLPAQSQVAACMAMRDALDGWMKANGNKPAASTMTKAKATKAKAAPPKADPQPTQPQA